MLKQIISHLLIFSSFALWSQKGTFYNSLDDLKKHGYEVGKINYFPISNYDSNALSAWFGIHEEDKQVALFFFMRDSSFVLRSEISYDTSDYSRTSLYVEYKNDTLIVDCYLAQGNNSYKLYTFKKNQLVFEREWTIVIDPNSWLYDSAKVYIQNRDALSYCMLATMGQWVDFSSYAVNALYIADTICTNFYKAKKYAEAAKLMNSLEKECEMATTPGIWTNKADFKRIWGNASLYYLKAGMNRECVDLCAWFTEIYPDYRGIYLQWADALFNLNDKEEAKKMYAKYCIEMTAAGEQKKIPSRVKKRMK